MPANGKLYISPGELKKRGFEDLECYERALELMAQVHELVKQFPADEKYDLVFQIRRSSKSVTANIAEGYGRYHYLDSLHSYSIARGELNETLSHLITAQILGYIDVPQFQGLYRLARAVEQLLNGYMAYIRRKREGTQEYGDRSVHEDSAEYEMPEQE
jgi:four helix bundle protein